VKVTVKYWGQIKRIAGRPSDELELAAGATVRELLDSVADRHGAELAAHLVEEGGAPRPSLVVTVDGVQASFDPPAELHDGAEVALLPPIAGGAPRGPLARRGEVTP